MMDDRFLSQRCPGGTLYTILPGDSFYGLSRRFRVTIDALLRANPGVSPTNLIIGQRICIPVPPGGPCPGGFTYTIQPGDTLYSLGRRFGTVPQAIAAANPGLDPNSLQVGRIICIPAPLPGVPSCPGGRTHTIIPGDTLYALARRYNTTVAALLALNPSITSPEDLRVGQIICVG